VPGELLDALYYIDELATPSGLDALLTAAEDAGLSVGKGVTPAEVALQLWLADRGLVERLHAQHRTHRHRSFTYFQTDRQSTPEELSPSHDQLRRLERALDQSFESKRRGRGTRIFIFSDDTIVRFAIRHGGPFRREGTIEEEGTSSVFYRPEVFDAVVYLPTTGELGVHAQQAWERELYRRQFGRVLFGSEDFFPVTGKYTLEPLRRYGEAALNCIDVAGIEWIRLCELHLYWGGAYQEVGICKATDVLAALAETNREIPEQPRLVRAGFRVKFADCRTPRSVIIRPSNVALYTRDDDSIWIEQWLDLRGFILGEGEENRDAARQVLAVA